MKLDYLSRQTILYSFTEEEPATKKKSHEFIFDRFHPFRLLDPAKYAADSIFQITSIVLDHKQSLISALADPEDDFFPRDEPELANMTQGILVVVFAFENLKRLSLTEDQLNQLELMLQDLKSFQKKIQSREEQNILERALIDQEEQKADDMTQKAELNMQILNI